MRIETQFTSLRASKSCWSGFFSNLQIRVHLSKRSNRFSFTTSTLHQQSVTRPDLFTQNDGIPSSDPDPERIEHSPFSSSSSSSDQTSDSALPKGSYVYKSQKRHSPATTPELEETLRPYEERWRGNPFFHILASPLRQCVATKKVLPKDLLLELKVSFVKPSSISQFSRGQISPSGAIMMPHALLRNERSAKDSEPREGRGVKKPGRGIWLTLDRKILDFVGRTGIYKRLHPLASFPKELSTLIRYQLEKRVVQEARLMKSRIVTQPRYRITVGTSQVLEIDSTEIKKPKSSKKKKKVDVVKSNETGELVQGFSRSEPKNLQIELMKGRASAWLDFSEDLDQILPFEKEKNSRPEESGSAEAPTESTSSKVTGQDSASTFISSLSPLSHYPIFKLLSLAHANELREILFCSQRKNVGLEEEAKSKMMQKEDLVSVTQDDLTVGLTIALYRLRIWKESEEANAR